MDLSLDCEEGCLNIRVAALIQSQGKLLISMYPDGLRSLPGGRVLFGENTRDAIQREIMEETGYHLKSPALVGIIENFFEQKKTGKKYHEYLYVYREAVERTEMIKTNIQKDQTILWQSLETARDLEPRVLTQFFQETPPNTFQHIVNNDHL